MKKKRKATLLREKKRAKKLSAGKSSKINDTPLNFYFTRHAQSCNNAQCGQSFTCYDKYPGLTKQGINDALKQRNVNRQNIAKRFKLKNMKVCVSVLVRTWMTATLLYGGFSRKLELFVSPYIRESGFYGNEHHSIEHTLSSYKIFLDKYIKKKINIHIKIPIGINKWGTITFEYSKNDSCWHFDKKWILIEDSLSNCWSMGSYTSSKNKYVIHSQNYITDSMSKSNKFIRSKNGHRMFIKDKMLEKFINFAFENHKMLSNNYAGKKYIITVCHNRLMKKFIDKISKKLYESYNTLKYFSVNLWSMSFKLEKKKIIDLKIFKGSKRENYKKACLIRNSNNCKQQLLCGRQFSRMVHKLKRAMIKSAKH